MSQHGIEHTMVANADCDGARIDPANADNLLRGQPVAQMALRAEIGRVAHAFANDNTSRGFGFVGV